MSENALRESTEISDFEGQIDALIENMERIIFGKRDVIELCVAGLLARGHILIEDVPGIGKTTLAQALARSIDCSFNRIQFTSDMLPADIIGVSILDPTSRTFEFRPGPLFGNIVLADEVNRTPPKTQSALLEAMGEFHVSVDGKTRALPEPFMVLATQNPIEYEGTYTLPEAQLDRFLLRVEIGYPPREDELRIMRRHAPGQALDDLKPAVTAQEVLALQKVCQSVRVEDSVARYILSIIEGTRAHSEIRLGASPRGSLSLYEASQAWAMVHGRDFVTPGDVKQMAIPVLSHRVIVKSRGADLLTSTRERSRIVAEVVESVAVPV